MVSGYGNGGEGSEDVQSSNVDHDVLSRKVVEDVALCGAAEVQIPREGHGKTGYAGNAGRHVCDLRKAIHGRLLERAIDKKTVMV